MTAADAEFIANAVLEATKAGWRKVALVNIKVRDLCEAAGVATTVNVVTDTIDTLADTGKLEIAGDLSKPAAF